MHESCDSHSTRRVSILIHVLRYRYRMTTITINGTMSLGKLLQMFRQMAGLDQTQMGERIGASRPTISAWERGEREPSFSQVVAWAHVTGQPIEPLVSAAEAVIDYGSEGWEFESLRAHSDFWAIIEREFAVHA